MSMLNSSENLGIPVEVGAIDGELKKLWEADEASTNASLMNFLVYTEDRYLDAQKQYFEVARATYHGAKTKPARNRSTFCRARDDNGL